MNLISLYFIPYAKMESFFKLTNSVSLAQKD